MKRMPTARATASVPPTVVAPTAPCGGGREVARPALRAEASNRRELLLRQPDAHLAVQDADRRGHRAGRAHLPLRLEPDLDAFPGREAVRDERRLERDDGAAAGERVAHLVGDADHAGRSISTNRLSSPRRTSRNPARRYARSARSFQRATQRRKCAAATRGARSRGPPR